MQQMALHSVVAISSVAVRQRSHVEKSRGSPSDTTCKFPFRPPMHAGYPWLPEPQQQGLTSAAASEAAQAAAQSPSASATGHVSASSPTVPDRLTGNLTEAAMHKAAVLTGAEGQRSASASGAVLGSGGAVLDALGPNTPYTPPSAGRGSESGVSTSETSSLSNADRLLPASPNALTSSKKTNAAVLPPSQAQVTPLITV